ncbi:GatB/YqeY domain-containing protein [Spirilliplanes yamanashiensis]|uniref:Uncharacterized protein n=1 Tax=Spirilliplanes yamanashiensis TaxID=42233 RepID=A0A8J4DI11_9ACTN|nr:GatB/YqeY domain-containing protein [Spirilliplanes yamanashiensis]MDP9819242.1 uncharacterized protein YqeY [Spirilliplanes yamanashiensis]GIJ01934.1 hypothetical protein Sya03_12860 [Spirilliplanes yamanashiensis]
MSLVERLQAALTPAMRARDGAAVAALRSALAAVANAEAVPAPERTGSSLAIGPGTALGAGGAEAVRRELTDDDVRGIVSAEVAERHDAAESYDRLGRAQQAAQLRAEAAVLAAHLDAAAS